MNTEENNPKDPVWSVIAGIVGILALSVFCVSGSLFLADYYNLNLFANPDEAADRMILQSSFTEPLIYSGSEKGFVEIDKASGPAIAHITGNNSSKFFQVIQRFTYTPDPSWNSHSLVYSFDPHEGYYLLDPYKEQHTYGFDVSASSGWVIEILPLSSAVSLNVPGNHEGTGSVIIALEGKPKSVSIEANAGYFSLWVWSPDVYYDLVSTNDALNETFELDPDIRYFEIQANGIWSIQVND